MILKRVSKHMCVFYGCGPTDTGRRAISSFNFTRLEIKPTDIAGNATFTEAFQGGGKYKVSTELARNTSVKLSQCIDTRAPRNTAG